MTRVIGVRFRTAGKIYFFDPMKFEIKRGDHVIVETARGIEFGTVMAGAMDVEDEKVVQPLKPVLRIANQRDLEQAAANKEKEKEAFRICLEKIREHGLEMKLIDAEYTFDNNKVLFYFTADGRIDFRELVKDLAGVFKTRIELRQIGVRDETKIVGGIGICGRPLCCHSYLSDFVPVSIKMAKEQNLSLNPTKISGVCGRLMCCLKNEEETYEELNRRLPGIGDQVVTEDGLKGQVQSVNVLRQLVKVVVEEGDEKEIKEYPVGKLQFRRRHGKKEKLDISKEELQELTRLEEEDQQELQENAKQEGNQKREGGRQKENGRQGSSQRQESGQRQGGRNRQSGNIQNQEEGSTGAGNTWERGKGRDGNRSRQPVNPQGQEEGSTGAEGAWEKGRDRDGGRNRQSRWNQRESQDWESRKERQGSRNYQDSEGREEDSRGRGHQNDRSHQEYRGHQGNRSRQGSRERQNQKETMGTRAYGAGAGERQQVEAGEEVAGQASRQAGSLEGDQRQRGSRNFRGRNRHFRSRGDKPGQERSG